MLFYGASSLSFNWDHQVGISLYLLEGGALHKSKELVGLKPPYSTFNSISLVGFPDFKINFHFIGSLFTL